MVVRYLRSFTEAVIAEYRNVNANHHHKVGDVVSPVRIRDTAEIIRVDEAENGDFDYFVRFL